MNLFLETLKSWSKKCSSIKALFYNTTLNMKPLQHQTSLDVAGRHYLSLVMRKPVICICENKDADQLRGNREADQRICFRYTASTRNDITVLALYGHGSKTILFFSMGHRKVIHFPIIIWFYTHFL